MAPFNKWWILCVVSLSCVPHFGSCRRHRENTTPSELLIFNERCIFKNDPGPCKASKDRYFFNLDTRRCEPFEYGGCQGNDNNFVSLEECEEACIVSDDKNPCHLKEYPGPCRGMLNRYLFDNEIQQCRSFHYGGCFGNANNFRSMAECQRKCPNGAKTTKAPEVHTQSTLRLKAVQSTVGTDELTVTEAKVQTSDTDQEPKAKTTKAPEVHTQSTLRLKAVQSTVGTGPCFSPVDRGTCDGAEKRYAFNPKSKKCHVFSYSGCGGNENNFTSRKMCSSKCIRHRGVPHGKRLIRIRKKNLDNRGFHPV